MATFGDFEDSMGTGRAQAGGKTGAQVSVSDLLGALGSGNGAEAGKREDVAGMFGHALREVRTDMGALGGLGGEMLRGNQLLADYMGNLSRLELSLSKFMDREAGMSKADVAELSELSGRNNELVAAIDRVRQQDAGFHAKIQEMERRSSMDFRRQGVMQEEQARIQKKYNLDASKLWEGIGEDIDSYRGQLAEDLKSGLIEGVGGPLGVLGRQLLLPGIKGLREAVRRSAEEGHGDAEDIAEGLREAGQGAASAQEAQAGVQEGMADVAAGTKAAVEEMAAPSQASAKKRLLAESRASRSVPGLKEPGVFARILSATDEGNKHLSHISASLRDQLEALDGSYEVLAGTISAGAAASAMSEGSLARLAESAEAQGALLAEARDTGMAQQAKAAVAERVARDVFRMGREEKEQAVEDREEAQVTQLEVLEELEDLNRKGIGRAGKAGEAMPIPLKGLASSLGKFGKALGAATALLTGLGAGLGAMGIIRGLESIKEKYGATGTGAPDFKAAFHGLWEKVFGETGAEREAAEGLTGVERGMTGGQLEQRGREWDEMLREGTVPMFAKPGGLPEGAYYREEDAPTVDKLSAADFDRFVEQAGGAANLTDKDVQDFIYGTREYIKVGAEYFDALKIPPARLSGILMERAAARPAPEPLGATVPPSPGRLDREVARAERQMAMAAPRAARGAPQQPPPRPQATVRAQEVRRKPLDEVALLPDNFGLIMINSGMDIT